MKWVTHKKFRLVPMSIVDIDVDYVLDHLWETSESIKERPYIDKGGVIRADEMICRLDPGGMLNMREEWIKFEIDGCNFEVQLSKLSWLISKVGRARERIPNCKRIGLFHYHVICSVEMADKLIEKLNELDKSDAAFHAKLDDSLMKMELEKRINIVFPEIPREPGNEDKE